MPALPQNAAALARNTSRPVGGQFERPCGSKLRCYVFLCFLCFPDFLYFLHILTEIREAQ